jgi:hypothetical protein
MRIAVFMLVVLGVALGSSSAQPQPKHGDLVITYADYQTFTTGGMLVLDATSRGWGTLALPPAGYGLSRVRMSADNKSLVALTLNSSFPPAPMNDLVVTVSPTGSLSTQAVVQGKERPVGIELDHDGYWIIATYASGHDAMLSLNGSTLSTLFSTPRPASWGWFFGLAIDRDPGAPPYVVGRRWGSLTTVTPMVQGAVRNGVVTTLYSAARGSGIGMNIGRFADIEVDPATGDYLICACPEGGATGLSLVVTMSKNGSTITTLQGPSTMTFPFPVRFGQDGQAWIACIQNGISVHRLDVQKNTITWTQAMPAPPLSCPTGIEVYGSRALVCRQAAGTVTVKVQSQSPFAPGATYALAASFARRPGIRLPNGERLDLDVTDPLFFVSALGFAPATFHGFQGQLDGSGNATATVSIPAGLPKLNDLAVFVAGVILQKGQVIQVTNTHWFVLP